MSITVTLRLPEKLAEWLRETAERTGLPVNRIVREHLQRAKEQQNERPYMKLAGKLKGLPRDLSMREGFGRR